MKKLFLIAAFALAGIGSFAATGKKKVVSSSQVRGCCMCGTCYTFIFHDWMTENQISDFEWDWYTTHCVQSSCTCP